MEVVDLYRIRKDKKKTQKDIALIVDCKQSFISQIENGQSFVPEGWIPILVEALGIENIGDYITYISDEKNSANANNGGTAVSGNRNKVTNGVTADPNIDKLLNEISEQRKMYASHMDRLFAQLEKRDEQIDKLINR